MGKFIALLAVLFIVASFWLGGSASSENMASVISRVNNSSSDEVKSKLVDFLKETPNPTRQELLRFENEINRLLVIDLSRQATGDHSLQAKLPDTRIPPDRTSEDYALGVVERVMLWLFGVLTAGALSLMTYRKFKNKEEGF